MAVVAEGACNLESGAIPSDLAEGQVTLEAVTVALVGSL